MIFAETDLDRTFKRTAFLSTHSSLSHSPTLLLYTFISLNTARSHQLTTFGESSQETALYNVLSNDTMFPAGHLHSFATLKDRYEHSCLNEWTLFISWVFMNCWQVSKFKYPVIHQFILAANTHMSSAPLFFLWTRCSCGNVDR